MIAPFKCSVMLGLADKIRPLGSVVLVIVAKSLNFVAVPSGLVSSVCYTWQNVEPIRLIIFCSLRARSR